jgi:hypothetical protein
LLHWHNTLLLRVRPEPTLLAFAVRVSTMTHPLLSGKRHMMMLDLQTPHDDVGFATCAFLCSVTTQLRRRQTTFTHICEQTNKSRVLKALLMFDLLCSNLMPVHTNAGAIACAVARRPRLTKTTLPTTTQRWLAWREGQLSLHSRRSSLRTSRRRCALR